MRGEVDACSGLGEGERLFMELGRARNLLAHTNLVVADATKTFEEVSDAFKKACPFVSFVLERVDQCARRSSPTDSRTSGSGDEAA